MKNAFVSLIPRVKKIAPIITAVLFAAAFMAASPEPSKIKVTISAGKFSIDKAKVAGNQDWKIAPFREALGSAREKDGFNKTHTYDNLGIVLFERTNNKNASGDLIEVQIHFPGSEASTVSPSGHFKGTVNFNGLKLNESTAITPAKLRKKLKGWNESEAYISHNFRFTKNGIYVYAQFNEDETRIVKLSIGPDKE